MKKFIYVLLSVLFISTGTFAQDKMAKTPAAKNAKTEKSLLHQHKEQKLHSQKLKKDGTPDMRYSENKKAKADMPAGPMKKDGTPDMRHKANKNAAASAKAK